jgi:hypothetical protein
MSQNAYTTNPSPESYELPGTLQDEKFKPEKLNAWSILTRTVAIPEVGVPHFTKLEVSSSAFACSKLRQMALPRSAAVVSTKQQASISTELASRYSAAPRVEVQILRKVLLTINTGAAPLSQVAAPYEVSVRSLKRQSSTIAQGALGETCS